MAPALSSLKELGSRKGDENTTQHNTDCPHQPALAASSFLRVRSADTHAQSAAKLSFPSAADIASQLQDCQQQRHLDTPNLFPLSHDQRRRREGKRGGPSKGNILVSTTDERKKGDGLMEQEAAEPYFSILCVCVRPANQPLRHCFEGGGQVCDQPRSSLILQKTRGGVPGSIASLSFLMSAFGSDGRARPLMDAYTNHGVCVCRGSWALGARAPFCLVF